jgi:hypothetical protein
MPKGRITKTPSENDSSFSARLIRYRKGRKFSRDDLADFLRAKGFEIGKLAILRWEMAGRLPRNPELYQWFASEFKRFKL